MRAAAFRLARADLARPPRADRAHRLRDLRRRHRAGRHAGAARRARRAVRGRDGADQRRARRRLRRADRRRRRRRSRACPGWPRPNRRPRANVQAPLAGASVDVGLEALPARDRPAARHRGPPPAAAVRGAGRSAASPAKRACASATRLHARRHRLRDRRPGRDDPAGDLSALASGHRLGAGRRRRSRRRVGVRLADPEAIERLRRGRPAGAARPPARGFTDWHDVRDTITDQTRTYSLIISINTLLALFAVGFTVATVISGRVLAQRREIGLMKAIGFSPARHRRAARRRVPGDRARRGRAGPDRRARRSRRCC